MYVRKMITGLWCTGLDNSWDYRCRERGKKSKKKKWKKQKNGKARKSDKKHEYWKMEPKDREVEK